MFIQYNTYPTNNNNNSNNIWVRSRVPETTDDGNGREIELATATKQVREVYDTAVLRGGV